MGKLEGKVAIVTGADLNLHSYEEFETEARLTPQQAPAAAFQTDNPAGLIHIDVKYLPPLCRRRSYGYGLPPRRR